MRKISISVLMGGESGEREVSLASGSMVLEALLSLGHSAHPVEISPQGLWLKNRENPPQGQSILESVARSLTPKPDIVFIALHGPKGEDGTVQGLLEMSGIPYTGSGVLASALGMDKHRSRLIFQKYGLSTPPYLLLQKGGLPRESLEVAAGKFGLPLVVKPNDSGSSLFVTISSSLDQLEAEIDNIFQVSSQILIEKYLPGVEITVPLLGNDDPEPLPVIEIVPPDLFFDFRSKYNGSTKEICPARIEEKIYRKAQEIARIAFKALNCRGFARADMIYSQGEIYLLEVNTIPGLTRESLFPKSAKVAGLDFPDLIEEIVRLGLMNWGKEDAA
ncbi:MAG: D-alanine--D-alanine ligase [Caldiserica bacterium]|jgi:D-alanine-D-alanine ligase|nr:D-alanine--D-alanine ligase [Caldisericota bacterium]